MHPQLLVGVMQPELYHPKEPNFFGNTVFRTHGMDVYERFLQPQQGRADAHVWRSLRVSRRHLISLKVIDATSALLTTPSAAMQMQNVYRNRPLKILVMLRDPVERMLSQYRMLYARVGLRVCWWRSCAMMIRHLLVSWYYLLPHKCRTSSRILIQDQSHER
jgi:hypothetical protein